MEPLKITLILVVILLPLCCILYYFGIGFTSKACVSVFHADYSFPTRWEGKFQDTSGYMHRNFVIFKKYSALFVEIGTASGTLDVEVRGPDGSILSPASGIYGQDASVLVNVSQFKLCSVTLRMDHFSGRFHIALQ